MFELGERVTPQGSPDENGPWRNMGVGIVSEPVLGLKPGYVPVKFHHAKESYTFHIKARNLTSMNPAKLKHNIGSQRANIFGHQGYSSGNTSMMPVSQSAALQSAMNFNNPISSIDAAQRKGEKRVWYGVRLGGFVKAKSQPWRDMGVGFVLGAGNKPASVRVRFNIMGDVWTLNCKDVVNTDDPGACDFQQNLRKVQYPAILQQ